MRSFWAIVAVCVLASAVAFGQHTAPTTRPTGLTELQWKLASVVVASEGRYEPMLSTELANLAAIRKGKIVKGWAGAYTRDDGGEYTFYDGQKTARKNKEALATESQARIDFLQDLVRRVKAGEAVIPDLLIDGLDLYAAGNLKDPPGSVSENRYNVTAKVVQVVSETEMLVSLGVFGDLWLSGYSTSGIIDGRPLSLRGPHIVSGTKQYQTAAGPRTVFKLEPVSADGISEAAAYLRSSPTPAPSR